MEMGIIGGESSLIWGVLCVCVCQWVVPNKIYLIRGICSFPVLILSFPPDSFSIETRN